MKNIQTRFSIKAFILIILSVLVMPDINAQVEDYSKSKAKRAERRAKYKGDQEVNKQVDQGVDKAFNAIKDAFKKKYEEEENEEIESTETEESNESPQNDYEGMDLSALTSTTTIDKTYKFARAFEYDVTVEEGSDSDSYPYHLLVPSGDEPEYVGMELQDKNAEGMIIFDHDIEKMVMFTGNNSGTIMSFDDMQAAAAKSAQVSDSDYSDVSIKKSGKTGTHLGYKYVEYTIDSEEGSGIVWVAQDEGLNPFNLLFEMGDKLSGGSGMPATEAYKDLNGLVLKSVMKSSKDDATNSMELKRIADIDKSFDASQYQLMDIGGFMRY